MERKTEIAGKKAKKNKEGIGSTAHIPPKLPPKKEEIQNQSNPKPKPKFLKKEIMQIGGKSYNEDGFETADIDESKLSEEEL